MENLFNFDYSIETINNHDEANTESRFSVVRGEGGMVVHTKKDAYQIIPTQALSNIAQGFVDQGRSVSSFVRKHGETIGITVTLGNRQTKVGDVNYKASITVPNNGGGVGYLSIHQTRMICTNGMVLKMGGKQGVVKIPHNLTYEHALELAQSSINEFCKLTEIVEKRDEKMNANHLSSVEVRSLLNQWFYNNETPESFQKEASLTEFRRMVFEDFESLPNATKNRYKQLLKALDLELEHNKTLNLKMSQYTVHAVVTNYLSRRAETSQSADPMEIRYQKASSKVDALQSILA